MLSLDDAYEKVVGGSDASIVLSGLSSIARQIGFDHVAVAYTEPTREGGALAALTTYPDAWVEQCTQLPSHLIALDPILKHLSTEVRPLVWDKRAYSGSKTAQIYETFSAFGLGSGMTVNVRGVAGDCLRLGFTCGAAQSRAETSLLSELGALCMAATVAHHAFSKFAQSEQPLADIKLTQRELELLRWSRCGKTAWESSEILGISQSTAQFHLKNAICKLGAASKQQAVLRALELRLIS